jgi:hypothetical protein
MSYLDGNRRQTLVAKVREVLFSEKRKESLHGRHALEPGRQRSCFIAFLLPQGEDTWFKHVSLRKEMSFSSLIRCFWGRRWGISPLANPHLLGTHGPPAGCPSLTIYCLYIIRNVLVGKMIII